MDVTGWRTTAAIAAVTLIVSGLLIVNGLDGSVAFGLGFVPAVAGGTATLPPEAALVPTLLTPLSATLIHGGWAHLALNLVMLVFCGRQVERALGGVGVGILYLVGAYTAALGQWMQSPDEVAPMIGASGAISAVVAAYALLYGQRRPGVSELGHAAWLGAAWVGIQLLVGLAGPAAEVRVAVGAHIGGFAAGLVLARPLLRWRYRRA